MAKNGKSAIIIVLAGLIIIVLVWGGYSKRQTESRELILPPTLYGLVGQELNIYFDNIVKNKDVEYDFEVICDAGQHLDRCYRIVPTEAGRLDITIKAYRQGEEVASADAVILISAPDAGNGVDRKLLVIGDSTTASGICVSELLANFNEDVMNLSLLGTKGEAPYLHEGISGWTIEGYYSLEEFEGTENAFWNPETGKFDFEYYMKEQGYPDLDYVIFHLGINDIFCISDEADLQEQIDSMIFHYHEMIKSIRRFDEDIVIGLAITIPPSYSQDAFGKSYGTDKVRWRYKRHHFLWCERLIDEFKNQEENGVFLVPIHTNLDTRYNMGTEYVQVNARNPETEMSTIANGNVHPSECGYRQIADVYWYFLKSFEN